MPDPKTMQDAACIRSHMHEYLQMTTDEKNTAGFEISGMIRILANMYENAGPAHSGSIDLSGPRLKLLFLLLSEERRGNTAGITPSELSRHQNVTRNTISSLLRGLETQGLIERTLDFNDRRLFHIRLTPTGRELITHTAPELISFMNRLSIGLKPAEQTLLLDLLGKLMGSIQENCACGQLLPGLEPEPKTT